MFYARDFLDFNHSSTSYLMICFPLPKILKCLSESFSALDFREFLEKSQVVKADFWIRGRLLYCVITNTPPDLFCWVYSNIQSDIILKISLVSWSSRMVQLVKHWRLQPRYFGLNFFFSLIHLEIYNCYGCSTNL